MVTTDTPVTASEMNLQGQGPRARGPACQRARLGSFANEDLWKGIRPSAKGTLLEANDYVLHCAWQGCEPPVDAKALYPQLPGVFRLCWSQTMFILPLQGPEAEGFDQGGENLRAAEGWSLWNPYASL